MLSNPQETMDLHHPRQTKPVAITCMAFPNNEVNNFIVGSEEGAVYSGGFKLPRFSSPCLTFAVY